MKYVVLCCMLLVVLAGCKYIAPVTAVSGPEVEIQKQETPQAAAGVETTTVEVIWQKGDIDILPSR